MIHLLKIMNPVPWSALFWCVLASPVFSQASRMGKLQDAVTHEQLVERHRKAVQEDPIRKLEPAQGADPATTSKPRDLMAITDFICFNGYATIVPKQAILQTPAAMQNRKRYLPGSKLLTWTDFYALNRGWITTLEVSQKQAEGKEPFPEETSTRISKSTNLVVATFQGGPISVLPFKTPAESQPAKPKSIP